MIALKFPVVKFGLLCSQPANINDKTIMPKTLIARLVA